MLRASGAGRFVCAAFRQGRRATQRVGPRCFVWVEQGKRNGVLWGGNNNNGTQGKWCQRQTVLRVLRVLWEPGIRCFGEQGRRVKEKAEKSPTQEPEPEPPWPTAAAVFVIACYGHHPSSSLPLLTSSSPPHLLFFALCRPESETDRTGRSGDRQKSEGRDGWGQRGVWGLERPLVL